MKSIIATLLVLFSFHAYSQVDFPNPSPAQTIKQNFGVSAIEINYSRPGVKGRKIIGHNEPYGRVWRTGANAPTKVRFFSPVEIKGNKIDSGTYVLYAIPTEKDWTVILNKGVKNWGSDQYKQEEDVCRFTVSPERKRKPVETFTIQVDNVKPESCDITVAWEDWLIAIPVQSNVKETLRKQIEADLKKETPGYYVAAQFYYEYDNDTTKALEMIDKAIASNEAANRKPYWQYYFKARILKDLGKKQEATEWANLSAKYAKEQGNRNNYVQQSEDLIKSMK
jgi:tetratricopeptide (TPR) repeat protein